MQELFGLGVLTLLGYTATFHVLGGGALGIGARQWRNARLSGGRRTIPFLMFWGILFGGIPLALGALMQDWMEGGTPNEGLALAPAPEPNAGPDQAGDLIVARQYTASDLNTLPHLIVQYDLYPVTPTSVPEMPPAGQVGGSKTFGVLLIGVALLALGLILRRT